MPAAEAPSKYRARQARVWPVRARLSSRASAADVYATLASACTLLLRPCASRVNSGELASASDRSAPSAPTQRSSCWPSRFSAVVSCPCSLGAEAAKPGRSAGRKVTLRTSCRACVFVIAPGTPSTAAPVVLERPASAAGTPLVRCPPLPQPATTVTVTASTERAARRETCARRASWLCGFGALRCPPTTKPQHGLGF